MGPRDILHVYYDVAAIGKWERITSLDNQSAKKQLIAAVEHLTGVQAVSNLVRIEPVAELLAA